MHIYIISCTKLLVVVQSGYRGKETLLINTNIKDKGEKKNSNAVFSSNLIFKVFFVVVCTLSFQYFVHWLCKE